MLDFCVTFYVFTELQTRHWLPQTYTTFLWSARPRYHKLPWDWHLKREHIQLVTTSKRKKKIRFTCTALSNSLWRRTSSPARQRGKAKDANSCNVLSQQVWYDAVYFLRGIATAATFMCFKEETVKDHTCYLSPVSSWKNKTCSMFWKPPCASGLLDPADHQREGVCAPGFLRWGHLLSLSAGLLGATIWGFSHFLKCKNKAIMKDTSARSLIWNLKLQAGGYGLETGAESNSSLFLPKSGAAAMAGFCSTACGGRNTWLQEPAHQWGYRLACCWSDKKNPHQEKNPLGSLTIDSSGAFCIPKSEHSHSPRSLQVSLARGFASLNGRWNGHWPCQVLRFF